MIFVDDIVEYESGKWCHCWTDGDEEELHAFVKRIGLRREWAQYKPGFIIPVHYDLRPGKRGLAIMAGAKEVSMLAWMKERRAELFESGWTGWWAPTSEREEGDEERAD
jgi:hypothetical protein